MAAKGRASFRQPGTWRTIRLGWDNILGEEPREPRGHGFKWCHTMQRWISAASRNCVRHRHSGAIQYSSIFSVTLAPRAGTLFISPSQMT
jgi:hypothetical protein